MLRPKSVLAGIFLLCAVFATAAGAQELPPNFNYTRTLGEQTGEPIYNVVPHEDAMAYDAIQGNPFQALGVLTQPTRGKGGLLFFNAQKQFQLQIRRAEGVRLTIDGETLHIPKYSINEQRAIGRLKMETAFAPLAPDVMNRLLAADKVTVRFGAVVYVLDQDNIDALKYVARQIKKDSDSQ